ncbi:MAG: hypothetical protein ABIH23_10510 [bacterium]
MAAHIGQLITDIDDAMMTSYLKELQVTTVDYRYFEEEMKRRRQVKPSGKTFRLFFNDSGSGGMGHVAYNAALPKARQATTAYLDDDIADFYGRLRVYGKDIDATATDEMAVVRAVDLEMRSFAENYGNEEERKAFGDGGATPITICSACTDAAPCVVTVASTKYLVKGMPITFLTSGDGSITNGDDQVIEAITSDTTFTFTATDSSQVEITSTTRTTLAGAIANNSRLYHYGGYGVEWEGCTSLIGSTTNTIGTLNRATTGNEFYHPVVMRVKSAEDGIESGASASQKYAWAISDLRKIIQRNIVAKNGARKNNLQLFTTDNVLDYYMQLWENKGGYHEQSAKVDAWPYQQAAFSGIPILAGYACKENCMFIVDMSQMIEFRMREGDWDTWDSGHKWHKLESYDAYEAMFVERKQYGVKQPKKCGVLWDMKGLDD